MGPAEGADVTATHDEAVWVHDAGEQPGTAVHAQCTKAVIHEVAAAQTSVFHVAPGGQVRAHWHSACWDLFVGLGGEGEIEFAETSGARTVPMRQGSFCAMPPGKVHEVRNVGSEEFSFVLVHTPYENYDHRPAAYGAGQTAQLQADG